MGWDGIWRQRMAPPVHRLLFCPLTLKKTRPGRSSAVRTVPYGPCLLRTCSAPPDLPSLAPSTISNSFLSRTRPFSPPRALSYLTNVRACKQATHPTHPVLWPFFFCTTSMSLQNNLTLDILRKAEEGKYGILAQTWSVLHSSLHSSNV
jgi:hypothetical protein